MTKQPPDHVVQRVFSRVVMGPNGCHVITGRLASDGYGLVRWDIDGTRHQARAHRVVWQAAHGPIPDDMTVDHICRTPRCIRLDHLRLLSRSENSRRNWGRDYPLGQSCPVDHPSERRRRRGGAMVCIDCVNAQGRAWKAANPESNREASRRWRAANQEKHRETVRRYRAAQTVRRRASQA